ncbi:Filamin-B [Triplophysa tibetana]|uniref:Filamin-B n=1 Tax=Triplophysa tibetana TaxID=1572043 RepID=A0A5A9NGG0_9TELE|nr:Filamin-B [Triplophysa tibetana]
MPATEKDLADDAPWKKIQQNTFTRWCNEHLKSVNKRIADLQLDLSDGLRLISLLEILSQKKMYRKYHARPTFRQMKLENVSVALEFLDRENIKLVSIALRLVPDSSQHCWSGSKRLGVEVSHHDSKVDSVHFKQVLKLTWKENRETGSHKSRDHIWSIDSSGHTNTDSFHRDACKCRTGVFRSRVVSFPYEMRLPRRFV